MAWSTLRLLGSCLRSEDNSLKVQVRGKAMKVKQRVQQRFASSLEGSGKIASVSAEALLFSKEAIAKACLSFKEISDERPCLKFP